MNFQVAQIHVHHVAVKNIPSGIIALPEYWQDTNFVPIVEKNYISQLYALFVMENWV